MDQVIRRALLVHVCVLLELHRDAPRAARAAASTAALQTPDACAIANKSGGFRRSALRAAVPLAKAGV